MSEQTRTIFEGRIIRLSLEQVTLPNGKNTELEVIHHPGGVAIVVENEKCEICMLRQYRHAAGGWLWEIPAGKLENDTDLLGNAKREVLEEAGVTAENWQLLGKTVTSPGIYTEVVHIYYASELSVEAHSHEEEEVIEVHWLAPEKIHNMILAGEIYDAKTVIGFYLYNDQKKSL